MAQLILLLGELFDQMVELVHIFVRFAGATVLNDDTVEEFQLFSQLCQLLFGSEAKWSFLKFNKDHSAIGSKWQMLVPKN